jgi:hypothetical protein
MRALRKVEAYNHRGDPLTPILNGIWGLRVRDYLIIFQKKNNEQPF